MPLQRELSTRAAVGTIGDCPTYVETATGVHGRLQANERWPDDEKPRADQLRRFRGLAFVKPKWLA